MSIYTGFMRGPTLTLPKNKLVALLKVGLQQAKVTNKVEFLKISDSPSGGIMVLLVSEDAKDELANADFTLRIGAAGLIRFAEGQQRGQTRKLVSKIENAKQRREELSKEMIKIDQDLVELVKEKEKAANEATDGLLNSMKLVLSKNGENSNNDEEMETNANPVVAAGNEELAKKASSSST